MSLQSKLFLFFTGIVLVPLTLGGLFAQHEVTGLLKARDRDRVIHSRPGVVSLYAERVDSIPDRVALIASDPDFNRFLMAGDSMGLESVLRRELARKQSFLDFAAVFNAHGKPIAEVRGQATYLPGVTAPTPLDMLATQTARGDPSMASLLAAYTTVQVGMGTTPTLGATLVAGDYLDNDFAQSLSAGSDPGTGVAGDRVDVTVVVNGLAVASSFAPPPGSSKPWTVQVSATPAPVRARIGGQTVDALYNPLQDGVPATTAALMTSTRLISQNTTTALLASILGFLLLAIVGAALLGLAVTRAIARPLRELAAGADAIAAGVYEQHFDVRSADEVGQLARAFNEMTSRLGEHLAELQESREELKRSLTRFGETLRSTHDLNKILQVVLDTSVDALRASGGVLMVVSPETPDGPGRPGQNGASAWGREMMVAASRGVDASGLKIRSGEGIAGAVAVSGEPVRVPDGVGGEQAKLPDASPAEPPFKTAIWVPVFAQGRIFAVLALFDREDDEVFSPRDLDTVLSLADQAGVAIDNVVLHQEAQRLAITDGMTGIWNHRYFQLRFDQEMDRSARFRRPFCLLLFDIDDFKVVNDTYGHLVGNVVLIDLSRRVKAEIRDIDVLARYGGEEFVLILPETDADGGYRAAEKIRRRVADSPFGRERDIPVTISIGVACFPRAGTDQTALMRAADVALYQAKSRGKNTSVVFEPPQTEEGRAS